MSITIVLKINITLCREIITILKYVSILARRENYEFMAVRSKFNLASIRV
jgi:hypothetical protein